MNKSITVPTDTFHPIFKNTFHPNKNPVFLNRHFKSCRSENEEFFPGEKGEFPHLST